MESRTSELIDELAHNHTLDLEGYEHLVTHQDDEAAQRLADLASGVRKDVYGTDVFVRGLIEISSICKNDCLYCGLRASNASCERYRLTPEQILLCADMGYELGFRTFVLQGGEDMWFSDERLCAIVASIRERHPDCAITLSMGERSRESYARLRQAGADRYLLRHETADPEHYALLHPAAMSFDNRMRCLHDLRELGYAVGVGMMVGSPYQTPRHLAEDLAFIDRFKPEMCGIGPFIPHHATPFADRPAGTLEQTCYLLSIIRLIHPSVLLPATTALGTIDPMGREKGVLAGANVVMPNLSPADVRQKYLLYDGKICMGDEAAECRRCLDLRMERIGYHVVVDRGDPRP
ncbi:MAG: [Atopobiaceae bacterium]|nr:[FeFe] hydrogenase H-cluster radical SAM maturase HydE [Atopobiaceae bacterium]MBQ9316760.1 [FeFe] hydrogenase H-cluster radical SAM maturase HydE [Atopobiaceae bacterium]